MSGLSVTQLSLAQPGAQDEWMTGTHPMSGVGGFPGPPPFVPSWNATRLLIPGPCEPSCPVVANPGRTALGMPIALSAPPAGSGADREGRCHAGDDLAR